MSILSECPICKRKQSVKNKLCAECSIDLDKAKRSKKVRYWISFRYPGGKQRRELSGYSISEARSADGKRRSQKHENRIFDMLPESKMTFRELSDWYLNLGSVKKLASWFRIEIALRNFNGMFGDQRVNTISLTALENYQAEREKNNIAPATIDGELTIVRTMITKAFDNDIVDGRALKPFRRVKRLLKFGANVRKRMLSLDEYLQLTDVAQQNIKGIIIVAFNTGMRLGELRFLRWSYVDRKNMFFRLPAEITKEDKPKVIPINHHVKNVYESLPRAFNHDFVFTNKGAPIKYRNTIQKWFKRICKNAGISYGRKIENGITFHDIRRTVKTNMLNAGVDKVYRDLILGHSLTGMDVHYLAPNEDDLKKAMDQYTSWLDKKLTKALTKEQVVAHNNLYS